MEYQNVHHLHHHVMHWEHWFIGHSDGQAARTSTVRQFVMTWSCVLLTFDPMTYDLLHCTLYIQHWATPGPQRAKPTNAWAKDIQPPMPQDSRLKKSKWSVSTSSDSEFGNVYSVYMQRCNMPCCLADGHNITTYETEFILHCNDVPYQSKVN